MVGSSTWAGSPSTSRWFRVAGSPHCEQMACSLSTYSATAISWGSGSNGSPLYVWSIPETTTRRPDSVVVVGRRQADERLYLELDERRDDVYRVGDAVSPRKLDRAYYDGEVLARRL